MRKLSDDDFAFYAEIFPCLSWKEVKVLSLYCNGWDRNKVALLLNISVSTVKYHLSNAMEKINVDNNSELKPMFFFIVNGYKSCLCRHCHLNLQRVLPPTIRREGNLDGLEKPE